MRSGIFKKKLQQLPGHCFHGVVTQFVFVALLFSWFNWLPFIYLLKKMILFSRIEEGTYGVVYRAREKSTDEIVALKRLKMEKEKEGFPITSLREVNTLLKVTTRILFDLQMYPNL